MQKINLYNTIKYYGFNKNVVRFNVKRFIYEQYFSNIKNDMIISNMYHLGENFNFNSFFIYHKNQQKLNNAFIYLNIDTFNKHVNILYKFFNNKKIMFNKGFFSNFHLWVYKTNLSYFKGLNVNTTCGIFKSPKSYFKNNYSWNNYFVINRTIKSLNIFTPEIPVYNFWIVKKDFINDLRKKLILKKKRFCFLRKTKNNYFLTITDGFGNVLIRKSAGLVNIKSKKKKRSRDTFELICTELALDCFKLKIKRLDRLVVSYMSVNFSLVYKLISVFKKIGLVLEIPIKKKKKFYKGSGFKKISIRFNALYFIRRRAHNGVRKKKKKRL